MILKIVFENFYDVYGLYYKYLPELAFNLSSLPKSNGKFYQLLVKNTKG